MRRFALSPKRLIVPSILVALLAFTFWVIRQELRVHKDITTAIKSALYWGGSMSATVLMYISICLHLVLFVFLSLACWMLSCSRRRRRGRLHTRNGAPTGGDAVPPVRDVPALEYFRHGSHTVLSRARRTIALEEKMHSLAALRSDACDLDSFIKYTDREKIV